MKSLILRIIGILIILFSFLCPFPPVFGIPGLGWRAIIGGLGCFFLAYGSRRTFVGKSMRE